MKWIPPFGATDPNEQYVNAAPTIPGSNPPADFFNTILNELLAVIVAADMTPDDTVVAQVSKAIVALAERAATSGVTKGGFWFGKTTANFVVPNPTQAEQNYIDFTTLNTYTAKADLSGWDFAGAFVPPTGIDYTILITSKFWDIPEQDGQQGGWAQYNHTDDEWAWWPKIISFQNAALTGISTAPTPTASSPNTQIANKEYVDNAASNDLFDFKWRDATTNNTAWALSDGNWKTKATALAHLTSDYNDIPLVSTIYAEFTGSGDVNGRYYRTPQFDVSGATYEYAYVRQNTDGTITIRYANVSDGGTPITTLYWPHPEQETGDVGYSPRDVAALSIKTPHYDVIDGATIVYYKAADGHKICLANQETNLNAIYAATGVAWYYIIDTTNQRFKLPRDNSEHGQLISKGSNASGWYRVYADGWVEQGGIASENGGTITLPVEMADTNYVITDSPIGRSGYNYHVWETSNITTTSFYLTIAGSEFVVTARMWRVCGYCANTPVNQYLNSHKHLYFYVGIGQ